MTEIFYVRRVVRFPVINQEAARKECSEALKSVLEHGWGKVTITIQSGLFVELDTVISVKGE